MKLSQLMFALGRYMDSGYFNLKDYYFSVLLSLVDLVHFEVIFQLLVHFLFFLVLGSVHFSVGTVEALSYVYT